jgi:hypothetical protein
LGIQYDVRLLIVLPGAHAEQLRGRLPGVADEGEVLVAVRVDLARAHDDVTPARPHHVEHRSVRVVARHDLLGRVDSNRQDVLDEQRFAVGHHQRRLERRLGQAATDGGQRADRVGEDLAVAAEALGERYRAHLGARRGPGPDLGRAHAETAAW